MQHRMRRKTVTRRQIKVSACVRSDLTRVLHDKSVEGVSTLAAFFHWISAIKLWAAVHRSSSERFAAHGFPSSRSMVSHSLDEPTLPTSVMFGNNILGIEPAPAFAYSFT